MIAYVILSFNHPNITARAVQSVINTLSDTTNKFPFYLENNSNDLKNIFLIHNGSLEKNVQQLQNQFPDIHHILIPENKGYTLGVNTGLDFVFNSHSTANKFDWILFITNDCELLSISSTPKNPGLYAPKIFLRNTGRLHSLGGCFTPHKAHLKHYEHPPSSENKLSFGFLAKKYFYVPGTAFFIHQNTWRVLKNHQPLRLDENLHTYWEDVDYSVELQKLNHPVGWHSDCELKHGVGKTCHKDPFYTHFLFKRNRKIISRKHCPWYLRPILEIYFFIGIFR